MLYVPAALVAVFAIAYYGVRFLLGPPIELPECNFNIQAFELRGKPVYWQVQEGYCRPDDVNFDLVRSNIEEVIKEREEWPEAECFYTHNGATGFVFKFGTDFYDVEDLDCIQPLRDMQEEKENDINLVEWLKENFMPTLKQGAANGQNSPMQMLLGL